MKDENNDDFNRMLYFLFDRAKGNMGVLINNYDINIKLNSAWPAGRYESSCNGNRNS